jgi:hypothetical protein
MEIDSRNRHQPKKQGSSPMHRILVLAAGLSGGASAANAQVEPKNYVDSKGYVDTRCKESRGLQ